MDLDEVCGYQGCQETSQRSCTTKAAHLYPVSSNAEIDCSGAWHALCLPPDHCNVYLLLAAVRKCVHK